MRTLIGPAAIAATTVIAVASIGAAVTVYMVVHHPELDVQAAPVDEDRLALKIADAIVSAQKADEAAHTEKARRMKCEFWGPDFAEGC